MVASLPPHGAGRPLTSTVRVARGSDTAALTSDPIEPTWVLEGAPQARSQTWVTTQDKGAAHFMWDCTAGKFRWYFASDETVHVIDGSVVIETEDTAPTALEVGDAAYFPAGTWSTWTVDSYVRKHAVIRTPLPRRLTRFIRGFGARPYRLP